MDSSCSLEQFAELYCSINCHKWVFKGIRELNKNPTYKQYGTLTTSSNQLTVTLDPISVSVFKFRKSVSPTVTFTPTPTIATAPILMM